jgi:hypothetical protein
MLNFFPNLVQRLRAIKTKLNYDDDDHYNRNVSNQSPIRVGEEGVHGFC